MKGLGLQGDSLYHVILILFRFAQIPVVGQQLVDSVVLLRWQPSQHILQVGIRIVPI